ncbi:glycogen synthase GlgA [bacterium]|nr:glycogen synthase GlgA [bacterium]
MSKFNVLYLTSELYPMAKVGGLADVAGSLPKVLKDLEHDVRVFLPKYRVIRDRKYNLREVIRLRDIEVPMGNETVTVSVKSGFVPDSKVQAYFLEYKPYFDREAIYVDPKTGKGFEDDAFRFALFAKAALEMLKVLYWQPDLVHVNDWPSALLPYYLKNDYKDEEFFQKTNSLLTVHNLAYQGEFPAKVAKQVFGKGVKFDENHPAWHNGKVNFLKAGLLCSDLITTVSPTYAKEVLTPEMGAGLDSVLIEKKDRLYGVLNGIDENVWDPETDKELAKNYSVEEPEDKAVCREALMEEFELENPDNMLIGVIARMAWQKGFDLIVDTFDKFMDLPVNFVILGGGDKELEQQINELVEKYPGRLGVKIGHDEPLSHRIEAGADAFLMPSKYEPCGLNQLYSLRYGTIPIVHATGGLNDTVQEYEGDGKGNGFRFEEFGAEPMIAAVERAVKLFEDKSAWRKLMLTGMRQDYSWTASAKQLIKVYQEAKAVEVA